MDSRYVWFWNFLGIHILVPMQCLVTFHLAITIEDIRNVVTGYLGAARRRSSVVLFAVNISTAFSKNFAANISTTFSKNDGDDNGDQNVIQCADHGIEKSNSASAHAPKRLLKSIDDVHVYYQS